MNIQCENSKCKHMISVILDELDREKLDTTEHDTTEYSYEGDIKCPRCGEENHVRFETEEDNETGEILECERIND